MRITVGILSLTLLLSGCIRTFAVSTVGGIVDDGFEAFTGEEDLEFAEKALPGNLKLLDVMLQNEPDNRRLLRLGSEGYSSYALAFLEDSDPTRARAFYRRGRDYGLRILRQDEEWSRALDGTLDDLKMFLATRGTEDVPAVFWTAFGWGSAIYLDLSSPDAIADLPKTEAMMEFVASRDSTYYHGGADIFLGTLFGSRPRFLGGDTLKARAHFERALRVNGGRFLMTYVYYARSLAVQTLDEPLFDALLAEVDRAPGNLLPDARLANAVAKKKAELLRQRKSDLF